MTFGEIVLLAYAALMLAGGIAGYRAARSKPSLIAGAGSAVALVAAWLWARSSLVSGLRFGAAVTLLLCVVFTLRFYKTRKFMPSGMLLTVSLVALLLLSAAAFD